MKKIIFLDIDGTIRWYDGSVPQSAIDAIREARRNGHEVCICSGRPFGQIEKNIMEIGFDGVIATAGGYVQYQGKCIHKVCFSRQKALEISSYLMDNDCMVEMQRYDNTFLPASQAERFREMGRRMKERMGKDAKDVETFPELVEACKDVEEIEKFLFFSDTVPYDEIYRVWDGQVVMTPFSIPNAERWGGEISPPGVNKSTGIRQILTHSSCSRDDVIAIGDSDNDIDMLKFAAVGIAMGNATESAKEAADWQTDNLLEDGILKAFRKLQLIG